MDSENNDNDFEELMKKHLDKHGVEDKDEIEERSKRPFLKSVNNRPKRKMSRPDPFKKKADIELDLHGCTVEESKFRFDEAINEAKIMNYKLIRLIHGGKLGSYGPVKKELDFLIKGVYRSKIKSSRLDSRNDGSTLIELKDFD